MPTERKQMIWLEVLSVRFNGEPDGACEVQLKGDKQDPKPEWWPVIPAAIDKEGGFETFKTIAAEMDKKRVVLAGLECQAKAKIVKDQPDIAEKWLCCTAIRFQTADQVNR